MKYLAAAGKYKLEVRLTRVHAMCGIDSIAESKRMPLLEGKNALIVGLSSERAIAWGIAQALHRQGAAIGFTYQRESRQRHAESLAAQLGAPLVARCDVRSDQQIAALIEQARSTFGALDIIVHAAVGADPADLSGP